MITSELCPQRIPNIPADARWTQNAITVAGGHREGNASNQLYWPQDLSVDDDQTMVIADMQNNRIIQWKNRNNNRVQRFSIQYAYEDD
ncbi:unnamed protein product [Rotaria sordida]|uniref:Uncharacterized protein n=1 Tax=Rotaria sordida TaxID=392033 RepID=A0A815QCD6_9BILA|nr:unnamed protein product [Rotaria sordida]CAF1461442.1 unnamed protein product [Rotaria sordida]